MTAQVRANRYVVTCLYGLEPVLADEVHERLGADAGTDWCEVGFAFDGSPARLKELRVAGNVFLEFDRFMIGHTKPDLDTLGAHVRRLPFDAWQDRWRALQELPGNEIGVSVLRRGEHNYTYEDIEEHVLQVLAETAPAKVTLEPRPLELRIEIAHDRCRLMGRLTPGPLAERSYKRYRAQGDTDPTLAAAMVRLSAPGVTDLFLDPFCGIGTIPIERALWGRAAAIAAGENKAKRVGWALANAELAGAGAAFACWDAFALPFADRAFSRLVTSPPQSDPASGQPWQLADFARLLAESLRVLQYGGIGVWLLERGPMFRSALKSMGVDYPVERLACSWKGRSWTIYTLRKVL